MDNNKFTEEQKKTAKAALIAVLAAALGYALFGKVGLLLVALYVVVKKL